MTAQTTLIFGLPALVNLAAKWRRGGLYLMATSAACRGLCVGGDFFFAEAFVASHTGAALFRARGEPGVGGGLAGAADLLGANHFGHEDGGGK